MRNKRKKEGSDINYLDLIPRRNEALKWHRDLKDRVILEVENTGVMNTIAQKVLISRGSRRCIWTPRGLLSGL